MYATRFHRASSLDAAAGKLQGAEDGKFLAGGQTLLATMKQRLAAPTDLVDLTGISELRGISASGDAVVIGAATRHAEVAESAEVRSAIPALAFLAGSIGDPAVRNMGTIGGSVANDDPAADYPAACLALDATIETTGGRHAATDFFRGLFETALAPDEIITRVHFTIPDRAHYEKFRNPASRYALCGVFVARMKDGSARVAATGVGSNGVFRVTEMEEALGRDWSPDAIGKIRVDPGLMLSDIHGSAAYRAHLVSALAKRAVSATA